MCTSTKTTYVTLGNVYNRLDAGSKKSLNVIYSVRVLFNGRPLQSEACNELWYLTKFLQLHFWVITTFSCKDRNSTTDKNIPFCSSFKALWSGVTFSAISTSPSEQLFLRLRFTSIVSPLEVSLITQIRNDSLWFCLHWHRFGFDHFYSSLISW